MNLLGELDRQLSSPLPPALPTASTQGVCDVKEDASTHAESEEGLKLPSEVTPVDNVSSVDTDSSTVDATGKGNELQLQLTSQECGEVPTKGRSKGRHGPDPNLNAATSTAGQEELITPVDGMRTSIDTTEPVRRKISCRKSMNQDILTRKGTSDQSEDAAEKYAPRSSINSQRVGSGRMTGLRAELMSSGDHTRDHTPAHDGTERTELTGSVEPQRLKSGRITGLRGELISSLGSAESSRVNSAAGSRRMSGLRGALTKQDKEGFTNLSDSHLPTFLDDNLDDGTSSAAVAALEDDVHYGPRLKTAVLAKGRHPLFWGSSSSDTCLLPEISSDLSIHAKEGTSDGQRPMVSYNIV